MFRTEIPPLAFCIIKVSDRENIGTQIMHYHESILTIKLYIFIKYILLNKLIILKKC